MRFLTPNCILPSMRKGRSVGPGVFYRWIRGAVGLFSLQVWPDLWGVRNWHEKGGNLPIGEKNTPCGQALHTSNSVKIRSETMRNYKQKFGLNYCIITLLCQKWGNPHAKKKKKQKERKRKNLELLIPIFCFWFPFHLPPQDLKWNSPYFYMVSLKWPHLS